jgi:hypothetical protein
MITCRSEADSEDWQPETPASRLYVYASLSLASYTFNKIFVDRKDGLKMGGVGYHQASTDNVVRYSI